MAFLQESISDWKTVIWKSVPNAQKKVIVEAFLQLQENIRVKIFTAFR